MSNDVIDLISSGEEETETVSSNPPVSDDVSATVVKQTPKVIASEQRLITSPNGNITITAAGRELEGS